MTQVKGYAFVPQTPLLVYDGDCGFCRSWVAKWKRLTGDRVAYAPLQQVADSFPQIRREKFESAVHLILPSGVIYNGARAVFETLATVPDYSWLLWLYKYFWGFAASTEFMYRLVAEHRPFFSRFIK